MGISRAKGYSQDDRNVLINGAVAMYQYIFSSLLGADMTMRQGTLFKAPARLLTVVPDATVLTLMDFLREPEKITPYVSKTDNAITQRYLLGDFMSSRLDGNRQQVLDRLNGVFGPDELAQMFIHPRNKPNLFEAMNNGSLILINTAKRQLKQEGCELFGRFMIALLSQAIEERDMLPVVKRLPTFVYIDEAHDYFDRNIGILINTVRKLNVGIILAVQNLRQLSETGLLQTVLSSTSIKYAGGISEEDARQLAHGMGNTPENMMTLTKTATESYFAMCDKAFPVKPGGRPYAYQVKFGEMERLPKMSSREREKLIAGNLSQGFAAGVSGVKFELDEPRPL